MGGESAMRPNPDDRAKMFEIWITERGENIWTDAKMLKIQKDGRERFPSFPNVAHLY